ncbi:hypothetical protein GNI_034190 [Gregarina niphandrodes]|uniref:Transmembrane protein n=1 Tax=Gregarina niphandrodes TaxID=110365 RepID=A0A023BAU0_GRENI|nr:hypothetical protein GNI_034190 [Gregarina niphandrodes]EZG78617.1 hypothetical protein GNI_034190 [Gregarina niphandrodes]|eukprot:XP_011129237.1 hypothetical protein GNI_034190 [Gregarina niphandrodes]
MQILSAITCLAAISVASHHDLPAIKEGEHKVHKTTLSQSTSDIDAEITSRPTHMLKGASKQVDSMWDSV